MCIKLSDKQKLLLFQILRDSLRICDYNSPFSLETKQRIALYNDIVNSQDDKFNDEVVSIPCKNGEKA